jgi:hypothetical protein
LSDNALLTVYCVVFGGVNSAVPAWAGFREFTPPKTTQYTVNSALSLNYKVQPWCKDNKKVLPEDDPAGSKHVECVTIDDKTLFVHLFVISVFV